MLADSLVRLYEGNFRLHMDSLFSDSTRWRAFSLEGQEWPRVFGFGDSLRVVAPRSGTWSYEVRGDGPVWRAFGAQAVAGARLQEVQGELAAALQLGAPEGLLVLEVPDATPARRAGLQAGDLIIRAAGEPVATVEELRRAVQRTPRGEEVALEVLRRGQRVRLSLPGG